MWWFPAVDAAGVGPAEVAAQPVHHVVVGEAAAEVRDDGLDALGEAPGVGVERGQALHRGLCLCRECDAVDADGTAACDHKLAADQHLVDGAAVLGEHDLVGGVVERHEIDVVEVEQHEVGLVALGDLADEVPHAHHPRRPFGSHDEGFGRRDPVGRWHLGEDAMSLRDRPLTGCWKLLVDSDPRRPTGRRGEKERAATNLLYGDLLVAFRVDPEGCVSYSRRKEFYARRTRYLAESLTYTNVMRFVEREVERGIIDNKSSSPGRRGTQSRMRLSATAAPSFEHAGAKLIFAPPEIVILRDANKQLIDYADNAETRRIRFKLIAINDALAATKLTYQGRLMRPGDILVIDEDRILVRNALHRVFNRGSFDLGGRFYGSWWLNIKSAERRHIGVNGSRSVELDHSQLHPRLLYAIAGKSIDGDAYEIEGWNRPLVKEAMNTLINADDELSAMQSIAVAIGGKGAFERTRALIEKIKAKHSGIADSFGTGAGLQLMRIDSDMAESVQLKLIGRGIVGLPIHDSFIVEERHAGILEEIMDEVFSLTLPRISGRRLSSIRLSKNVPQYGGREDGSGPAANDNDGDGGEFGVA